MPLDARVLNDEPFGPVAVITRFKKLEDAIAEANRLPFGLASYAFTQDVSEANQIANGIEAGMTTSIFRCRRFRSAASRNPAMVPKAAPKGSKATW